MHRLAGTMLMILAFAGCTAPTVERDGASTTVESSPATALGCVSPSPAPGRGVVWGRVTDEGQAVDDAILTLHTSTHRDEGEEGGTDPNGCFAFGPLYGTYELHLDFAEGAQRSHGPFTLDADHRVERWNIDVHEAPRARYA